MTGSTVTSVTTPSTRRDSFLEAVSTSQRTKKPVHTRKMVATIIHAVESLELNEEAKVASSP